MDFREVLQILGRWWWLVCGLPLLAFAAAIVLTGNPPFESTLQATILIAGDTEIPGNAERPELMVLDDAPVLVHSVAFAEMVTAALTTDGVPNLSVTAVQSSLSSERYSRVLTIRATRMNAEEAKAITDAAAQILPDAINRYLVAENSDPATVRIINPPSVPTPANANRWFIVAIVTMATLMIALVLVFTAHSLGIRTSPKPQATKR